MLIYLSGCLIALVGAIVYEYQEHKSWYNCADYDLTTGALIRFLLIALLSWLSILFALVAGFIKLIMFLLEAIVDFEGRTLFKIKSKCSDRYNK